MILRWTAVLLAAAAPTLGAQTRPPATGSASAASVEVVCRLEMPTLCTVRDVQSVSVLHLGDGVHEVSFDVIVVSNTRWTLTVKPRPTTTPVPAVEVRNESGGWVPVNLERGPVTVVTGHAMSDRHAERVVFRLKAEDHLAALQLVLIEVLPTVPR